MRSLRNALLDLDPGFLRIIAELWGFDPTQGSVRHVAAQLGDRMLEQQNFNEFIAGLPPDASEALFDLVGSGGSIPWHAWQRKHGHIRMMGEGRRDREQPWRQASSPSEMLWYRGLLGRAFVDTPKGPEEFAYLPTEVCELLQDHLKSTSTPALGPIDPPKFPLEAAATIIDDCTSILAALRRQTSASKQSLQDALPLLHAHLMQPESLQLCLALMMDIGLLGRGNYLADLEAIRDFLLADRIESLQKLFTTWKASGTWNDLAALPTLRSGSDTWPNDPILARETISSWIERLTVGKWYSPSDLVRGVYREDAAFQRSGGNFDSWYLLDAEGIPLEGIEHWYAIEGALLHSLLKGPLRWFGVVQLGCEQPGGPFTHFAPTKLFTLLETLEHNLPSMSENRKATIGSDGSVSIPRLAPRSMRYQLARFLEWEGLKDQTYFYRLSIRAIQRAHQQDLQIGQVRSILSQASEDGIPPQVQEAMLRLEEHPYEAGIEANHILRVSDPDLLKKLQSHPKTKRLIHEQLSDTTAVVRRDQWQQLVKAAVPLGILIDGPKG